MEKMIVILLLVAVVAMLVVRRKAGSKCSCGSRQDSVLPPELPVNVDRELEARMAEFVEQDCFALMIQPVVDFRTGAASCGEVLSRLNHPERGMIFPEDFLPAVDAAGLYPVFDRYIFRKCCAWLSRTLAEGERFETISCNFSRKTLSEETIAKDLTEIADSYGLPHEILAIEITEREQETDSRQFHRSLKQLKESGFRLYLDDYGSGITCVRDLEQCPLDTVKIDRSMLLAAETEQGRTAYRDLVAMAKKLGKEVACEGIETEEQSRFAREAGCHYGQGFLFFRPMDTRQVFEMMEKSSIRNEA